MDILKIILTIIFVIDCIALSAIILLQEGKSAGLGTDQRSRRHILGTEQRTFYGGSACEVHEVSGCAFYRACARSESLSFLIKEHKLY